MMWGLWPKDLKYKTGETLTVAPLTEADFAPRHWGIWCDEMGDWWGTSAPAVFATPSYAVAKAQLAIVQHHEQFSNFNWSVRCFEEWADERR